MWTFEYIISQICVVLAMTCMCLSYLTKNKITVLILCTLSTILFGIQYALLEAWTGVAINIVGVVRGIWFYFNDKYNKQSDYISLITLTILLIILGIITYDSIFSIIATVAMIAFTYSIWQNKIIIYRLFAPPISVCWILYNIHNNSVFAIISESILMVFEIIGIIKYYITLRKNNTQEKEKTP